MFSRFSQYEAHLITLQMNARELAAVGIFLVGRGDTMYDLERRTKPAVSFPACVLKNAIIALFPHVPRLLPILIMERRL
jgi:hypothetical protein